MCSVLGCSIVECSVVECSVVECSRVWYLLPGYLGSFEQIAANNFKYFLLVWGKICAVHDTENYIWSIFFGIL